MSIKSLQRQNNMMLPCNKANHSNILTQPNDTAMNTTTTKIAASPKAISIQATKHTGSKTVRIQSMDA